MSINTSSATSSVIVSTRPANYEQKVAEVSCTPIASLSQIIQKARAAQVQWNSLGLEKRLETMRKLIGLFEAHRDEFARLTSDEMGMPLPDSVDLANSAITKLQWDLAHAKEALMPKTLYESDAEINELHYEPYGVIVCIVAWNFPLPNFVTSAVPALLAGNTIVMKYSEEVAVFAQTLERVLQTILPEGVVSFVYGGAEVGSALAEQEIDFISFTGSKNTGQYLYAKAAEKMIPITLELGGSSPGIVFADCEINNELIESIFWNRFANSGQYCDGLKRLIVHRSLFDECVKKLTDYAKSQKVGDPLDQDTALGPLLAERQVQKLEAQIQDAVEKGATIHCGGHRLSKNAAFFPPTILTNISKDMLVWREEVFGTALPVIAFDTYEEAIELANDTCYGLSGYVFTNNKQLEQKAIADVKAGSIGTLSTNYYRPQNPFGGYKCSGIGRQNGISGFEEVCQKKVIAIKK